MLSLADSLALTEALVDWLADAEALALAEVLADSLALTEALVD